MTDAAQAGLEAAGWSIMQDDGFIKLVGPFWHRRSDESYEFAILGEDKHRNRRGVVQGGVLMTLADRSCGMTARAISGADALATVQMDTYFVDAARIGELMVSRPKALRTTKSLIFMSTEIRVDDRIVATAHGVFKVVRDRIDTSTR
ncbi:PaaI family thioesterase [Tardiphaga sp.]|uniref:PaaI family thioesterase n=1 Tax=Tardiphaga sp. TaxID=1926292 RepID=UPI0019CDFE2B|nr:PaaI family thioesterase [Tardiphaga sp.]MBC7579555.1 PaaI family thioesterase [Tardiphaga sp.]